MTRHRTTATRTTAATLALAWALTGCAGDDTEASPSPAGTTPPGNTAAPSPTAPDEDDDEADEDAPGDESPDPVPSGFPDPETLIGQEAYDEDTGDGWRTVVGGEPLDLPLVFGSCFEGGTDDVCAYSISSSAPKDADGTPAPSDASLLLLLRSAGDAEPDTPTWEVLDAIIARTPDGESAILQTCDGEPGVAIYPAGDGEDSGDAGDTATVPVAAAWGPDDDVDELVELEPDEVTCAVVGP